MITVSISDTQDKELAAENSLRHFTSLLRMKQPFEFESDWYSWPFHLRSKGLSLKYALSASWDVQWTDLPLKTGLWRTSLPRVLVLQREESWGFDHSGYEITRRIRGRQFHFPSCSATTNARASCISGCWWQQGWLAAGDMPEPQDRSHHRTQDRTCPSASQAPVMCSLLSPLCVLYCHFVLGMVSPTDRVWELVPTSCPTNGFETPECQEVWKTETMFCRSTKLLQLAQQEEEPLCEVQGKSFLNRDEKLIKDISYSLHRLIKTTCTNEQEGWGVLITATGLFLNFLHTWIQTNIWQI